MLRVPLKVLNEWDFSAVSTMQQHLLAPVHTHFVCCCIQGGLTQNIFYVATTTQQHSGYSRKWKVCCL